MKSYTFRINSNRESFVSDKISNIIESRKPRVGKLVLFFEENEEGLHRPHAHGIIYTDYKRNSIRTLIKELTTEEIKGNSGYSLKNTPIEEQQYPENAYNYTAKGCDCIYNFGYTNTELQLWQKEGKDYVETKTRTPQEVRNLIVKECEKIKRDGKWEIKAIKKIIEIYRDSNKQPPIGYHLVRLIHYIIMKLDPETYIKMVIYTYEMERPFNTCKDEEGNDYLEI